MDKTLEQLQKEVNDIAKSLDELKEDATLSEEEKKDKAEELKLNERAKQVKQNISGEIEALAMSSSSQLEQAMALLDFFNEKMALYASILDLSETQPEPEPETNTGDTEPEPETNTGDTEPEPETNTGDTEPEPETNTGDTEPEPEPTPTEPEPTPTEPETEPETSTEEKGFFGKTKDWIGEQWKDIWDKEKWKDDTKNNVLRTTGFVATGVGLGALIYVGCKKLFSKESREERKQRRKEKKEARKKARKERRAAKRKERASLPFWQRPVGKVLKWTGIGTAAYFIAHGLYTGDWFKNPFKRGTEKTETAKEQLKRYEELSPEDRERYENVGGKVNEFYGKVREKEISNGYESPYDLGTISKNVAEDSGNTEGEVYKGLVPFCMDDGIKNIKELLSERNFTTYMFDKHATGIIENIKDRTLGAFGKVLGSFLSNLKSFVPFAKGSGSLGEKVESWIKADPEKRIDELNFFFRQYAKVLTYMKDKEKAIACKIVEEKCSADLAGKTEHEKNIYIQNKLKDNDWFKSNVENDIRYKNFMNSKILNSGEVLNNAGLFDENMSPILKTGIVEPLDDEFDNIMQLDEEDKSIIDKGIEEKNGGSLGSGTKENLKKMCDDLTSDMQDEDKGLLGKFTGIQYFLNTDKSNMQTFLGESGLSEFAKKLLTQISNYKTKIENGSITADELQKLKEVTLAYFAFQKEVAVATYTLGSIRSDNPDAIRRLIRSNIMGFNNFIESLNKIFAGEAEFSDYAIVGVGLGQGALILFRRQAGQIMLKAGSKAWDGAKWTVKHSLDPVIWVAGRPAFSNLGFQKALKDLPNPSSKQSYFLHYVLNGKIKDERFLLDIAKNDLSLRNTSTMGDALLELLQSTNSGLTKSDCDLLWKYAGNSDMKKLIISQTNEAPIVDRVSAGFKHIGDNFTVNTANLKKLGDLDAAIEIFESDNAHPNSAKFIKDMLNKSIKNVDDLDALKRLVERTDLWDLFESSFENLKATRKSLKHIDDVVNSKILKEIKAEIESTDDLLKKASQRPRIDKLNKHIEELKDFRKEFMGMDPKEFKIIEEFTGFFAESGDDVCKQAKIINKILSDGIEMTDGTKKVFNNADEITEMLKNPTELESCIRNAKSSWRSSVGLGSDASITNFIGRLRKIGASKKFIKNADDYIGLLKRTVKIIAKMS